MAGQRSLAEHYRAHREAFTLALQLKCTPREAELEIKRQAAKACRERLDAKLHAPVVPGMPELALGSGHDPDAPRDPYWLDR
jgi:hypothetical protein